MDSSAEPRLKSDGLFDDHLRADRHVIVEIRDVLIDQPEAAGRDGVANRLGLVGPVNAVDRLSEVEGAGAHRITRSARHEPRQIWLALDHLRRRAPVRPFLLAGYFLQARPLEALAADANAIAERAIVRLHEIEEALVR